MKNSFGIQSRLSLTAGVRGTKTILEDAAFTAPFKVMHPFYEKPGTMTVMLLTASAGIMAGDRQEWDILVKENARMEFVSQAYEKIHRMEDGFAERRAHITVQSGGELRYTPLPAIPFAQSDFRSTLEVALEDASSRFVLSEVLACGRAACGEQFGYRMFRSHVTIRQAGKLTYCDNTRYVPEQTDMAGFGMYEGFSHLANLVICNIKKPDGWLAEVRALLDAADDLEGGATTAAAGYYVIRILGKSGQRLTDVMDQILEL